MSSHRTCLKTRGYPRLEKLCWTLFNHDKNLLRNCLPLLTISRLEFASLQFPAAVRHAGFLPISLTIPRFGSLKPVSHAPSARPLNLNTPVLLSAACAPGVARQR